jgi:hypothetical protein
MDGLGSIRYVKPALACILAFALANVITVCPVLAHQVPAAQSCCEHSHSQNNLPCTDTTPNNCPYVLLEKSQAKTGLHWLPPAASTVQIEQLCAAGWLSSPSFSSRLADSSASYLRFRVLLI